MGKEEIEFVAAGVFFGIALDDRLRRSLHIVAALHHSWTSETSGLRGLFLITCRKNFLRGPFRREAVGGRRRLAPPLFV
ncbi:hypothetical protein EVAR_99368_1 [Eumeta japonica]|uniref:Uncharacterized protein n=1 Tax=Eumeta variegata TaxID=151549 RepID=A0A4C1YQ54_EUMVA|nr:hypothetical protein EVAR_99368_1 [Eumeta japonica]